MSIAVAVKKNNEVIIGADTLQTFGSNQPCKGNLHESKYVKVGNAYIANTGWGLYNNIIVDYLNNRKNVRLNNKEQIFTFFKGFWKALHEEYSFINDQCDEADSPFGDLDASFLIANKKGIFYVSSNMSVTEFNKFHAIGSGTDYALGAMYSIYNMKYAAEKIAKIGIAAAIEHNVYCGGEIEVCKV